jgi:predicted N-acetyltransferase YhbS
MTAQLVFRTLHESELEAWFDHCATVFTSTPRQYFVNHWRNDPHKSLDGIFVAVDGSKIAATVRVFHRELWINGCVLKMGGIGEVSTKEEYRGKGLASSLLSKAAEYMKENGFHLSSLHTGAQAPLYRKSGYESVYRYQHLQYVQLKLPQLKPTEKISKLKISQMSPELLAQLKELYNTYSQRFNGFAVRSDEYWSTWVKTEATNNWIWTNNENKLEAFLSIRFKVTKTKTSFVEVKEFLLSNSKIDETKYYFETLISQAVVEKINKKRQKGIDISGFTSDDNTVKLLYPAPLGQFFDGINLTVLEDEGTMFKIINEEKLDQRQKEAINAFIKHENQRSVQSSKHVFWSTDGF